ncbi:MAG: enoyl-CoA hydratase/isomerase family protein [Bdellovibrionales bacterium]
MSTVELSTRKSDSGHQTATLTITRPEAMNALNQQVLLDLAQALDQVESTKEIRAVVVTGSGEKSFVAGADIKEMEKHSQGEALRMAQNGQALLNRLEGLRCPVIAAVNGFALGGGLELALACDFILASKKAKWGLPEVTLGLIPGYGGTQRLSRVIGRATAKRVALSGEIFTAEQAYDWGLFTQLFEPQDLMPAALKLADTLASRAPVALKLAKQSLQKGYDLDLAAGLKLEAELFAETFATEDHFEGIKAFIEKRPPQFQGK